MSDRILESMLDPAAAAHGLPLFTGFPYLRTRVVDALRHIILLPEPWIGRTEELLDITRRQAGANQLDTALVMAAARAVFIFADGSSSAVSVAEPLMDYPSG